jgi:hypothetical protein
VNRWLDTLVSTTRSNACPQNGHWIFPETSILQPGPLSANRNRYIVIAKNLTSTPNKPMRMGTPISKSAGAGSGTCRVCRGGVRHSGDSAGCAPAIAPE